MVFLDVADYKVPPGRRLLAYDVVSFPILDAWLPRGDVAFVPTVVVGA